MAGVFCKVKIIIISFFLNNEIHNAAVVKCTGCNIGEQCDLKTKQKKPHGMKSSQDSPRQIIRHFSCPPKQSELLLL